MKTPHDATNLDELLTLLRAMPRPEDNEPEYDLTDLPIFGGEEPRDTAGIWSWDETRLLVTNASGDFTIIERATNDAP